MVAENENDEVKEVIQRIVSLETLEVGCGPICTCRASLAVLLDEKQAKIIDTLTHGVVFDKKEPPQEAGVLAAFGLSTDEMQLAFLKRMAADKHRPEKAATRGQKGGVAGAEETLRKAGNHMMMMRALEEALFGGEDFDIAGMSDDDIRQAAAGRNN